MLRIASDLDDTLFNWRESHEKKFNCSLNNLSESVITEQVNSLKNDGRFWSNLPLLERPDFVPEVYCTLRVNKKLFTINCIKKHKLPVRPILQLQEQTANKATVLKGVADVLIDDSWSNVKRCLESGFPALLITRPHNRYINTKYRINTLTYKEIETKYNELFKRI